MLSLSASLLIIVIIILSKCGFMADSLKSKLKLNKIEKKKGGDNIENRFTL